MTNDELSPKFRDHIEEMLRHNIMAPHIQNRLHPHRYPYSFQEIIQILRTEGYQGSESAIRRYIREYEKKRSPTSLGGCFLQLFILVFFIGLILVLSMGISKSLAWISSTLHPSPLAAQLNPYLHISPTESPDLSNPYIVGKIVIIDKRTQGIATIHYYSAFDAIRANDPKEVGTIIWLDCQEQVVGTYGLTGTAYQTTCTLSVIDKGKNTIVGKQTFDGPPPPGSSENGLDRNGGPPSDDDMVNYILSLPKR